MNWTSGGLEAETPIIAETPNMAETQVGNEGNLD